MTLKIYGNNTFTVANVLDSSQCEYFIKQTEEAGYKPATVSIGHDIHIMNTSLRNNSRVNIEDEALANIIWEGIKRQVPEVISGSYALGLDTTFRCYKYVPGEFFGWHVDGATKKNGNQSKFTVLLYLNNNYTGGETEFEPFKVKGTLGSVLVFPHKILHQGSEVIDGIKYVMRTDVMYSTRSTTSE